MHANAFSIKKVVQYTNINFNSQRTGFLLLKMTPNNQIISDRWHDKY